MSMRLLAIAAFLVLPTVSVSSGAGAQTYQPKLIRPAQFGTVREVEGDKLMIATARSGCPATAQPKGGGPCFDKLMAKLTTAPTRVLGLYRQARAGDRVAGRYGGDFALFDAHMDGKTLVAERVDLQTSDVTVPDNCYALNGEGVGYAVETESGSDVAYESQVVSCDGGPERPQGPYRPEGPAIASGSVHGWHRTEMLKLWGQMRYLATPGTTCDSQYSLRTTWCAQPAVSYLQAHSTVKELDLIAARQPTRAGDVLSGQQVDQWVLKRKSSGKFKADSRWVDKSMLNGEAGCSAVESTGWHVSQESSGLFITEGALNSCGAPLAPVPTAVYEAYGEDFFIVDCGEHHNWRDKGPQDKGSCFDMAADYLRRQHLGSATVVVLNERGRVDDYLYDGGYRSYDVAQVSLDKDGNLDARRIDNYEPSIYLNNCSVANDGPAERKGFVLVRTMGITWARSYRWMNCPIY